MRGEHTNPEIHIISCMIWCPKNQYPRLNSCLCPTVQSFCMSQNVLVDKVSHNVNALWLEIFLDYLKIRLKITDFLYFKVAKLFIALIDYNSCSF